MSTDQEAQGTSTRPYLIRALHDWCTDNGFTPYLAVYVDSSVQVPREYVKNNEIVLNVSFEATSQLTLGNDFIEFKARFGGRARDISVPVDHVIAIYARENGQGMAFPVPVSVGGEGVDAPTSLDDDADTDAGGVEQASSTEPGIRLATESRSAPKDKPSKPVGLASVPTKTSTDDNDSPETPPPTGGRPALRRIK
ncbi:MAG: ClpXP protease specificity-enhancing factor [Aquabacterium sp.]|uniref:ClpXP protease specificity-enhancing factor n=1 Tax=Aquabacterium sp. TaxID=1872578 RepID=UPI003BD3C26E